MDVPEDAKASLATLWNDAKAKRRDLLAERRKIDSQIRQSEHRIKKLDALEALYQPKEDEQQPQEPPS